MWIRQMAAAVLVFAGGLVAAEDPARVSVSPRPVVEKPLGGVAILAPRAGEVSLAWPGDAQGAILEGRALLSRRLATLGVRMATADENAAQVVLGRCSELEMSGLLERQGVAGKIAPARLKQAYRLVIRTGSAGRPRVEVRAADDRGLFYGLVTLCQLLDANEAGALVAPAIEILDVPAIAHRLAKTSAENDPPLVRAFVSWLPLYKLSQVGLQYHGSNSRDPEANFGINIRSLCPYIRKAGTLESIVYFCPFRGTRDKATGAVAGAYDFSRAADRDAYAEYLLWIMDQGAHGIEVDYNDWPGSGGVPIADVLNLAWSTVKRKYPEACVLYCPPATGPEAYRGMATPVLHDTLSRVPPGLWPLWTGVKTLITEPLTAAQVEEWTKGAGRRPFLWVNRVAPDVKQSFSRPLPGLNGSLVFQGELLPRDLDRLFEGVHLNAGFGQGYNILPDTFEPKALAYMATVADFLWNPGQWEPMESYRRAEHFVKVMRPLVSGTGPSGSPAR
jgi:hypothetical protein